MNDLPFDLISEITSYLSCTDIICLQLTNQHYRKTLSNEPYWQQKSGQEYATLYDQWRRTANALPGADFALFEQYTEFEFYRFCYSQKYVTYGSEKYKDPSLCLARSIKADDKRLEKYFSTRGYHTYDSIKQLIKKDRHKEINTIFTQMYCNLSGIEIESIKPGFCPYKDDIGVAEFLKMLKLLATKGNHVLITYLLKIAKLYHQKHANKTYNTMDHVKRKEHSYYFAKQSYRAAIIKGLTKAANPTLYKLYVTSIAALNSSTYDSFNYNGFKSGNYIDDMGYTLAKNNRKQRLQQFLDAYGPKCPDAVHKAYKGAIRGKHLHLAASIKSNYSTYSLDYDYLQDIKLILKRGDASTFQSVVELNREYLLKTKAVVRKNHWEILALYPKIDETLFEFGSSYLTGYKYRYAKHSDFCDFLRINYVD